MLLAIDPGPTVSAWIVVSDDSEPSHFGKDDNASLREIVLGLAPPRGFDRVAIENVTSYGQTVGREVFDTCRWIGRFEEAAEATGRRVELVPRRAVRRHHCDPSSQGSDREVIWALCDRFAPGQPNFGKGTVKAPGFFHGFKKDVWQAYALAVYVNDKKMVSLL
ncbi:MAG: hypothetical protein LBK54_01690 [Propionibacteriaceae bacterium]|jgi:hypothetical protein|nr:hypothetical protein [Propionibacteriaceae bacterium]